MLFSFTPSAARQVQAILAGKGGGLALRIQIRPGLTGEKWAMTLEPASKATAMVSGIPVMTDATTDKYLEGAVIDWIQTPEGAGFSVHSRAQRE